jgi:nitric oxide reductase large subunit
MMGLDGKVCPECGTDAPRGAPPVAWAARSQRGWAIGLVVLVVLWGLLLSPPLVQYYRQGYTQPGSDAIMILATSMLGLHLTAFMLVVRRRRWFRRKNPGHVTLEVVILILAEFIALMVFATALG